MPARQASFISLLPSSGQNEVLTQHPLQPGANDITIVGMTPTVDEHSIEVVGAGSAIITDITVELLPNRDIFEEIYPDSDSDSDSDESDEADDFEDDPREQPLDEVQKKLVALGDERQRAKEMIASAESRLKILDSYGTSLENRPGVDIEAHVETYRKERDKVFADHMEGTVRDRELFNEFTKLRREETRLLKLLDKEDRMTNKAKDRIWRIKEKEKEKKRRRDAERQKEKDRICKERKQFWPRTCYTVRISLDVGANFTPGTSRRNSIASAADVQVVSEKAPKADDACGDSVIACDLTLSYVTSSAFWAPSYDLALSSTTNTATLCFDARLTNMTSETWSNSRVTLSTSQANFSGLHNDIPTLVPWRLKIASRGGGAWEELDIVHSREERNEKDQWNTIQCAMDQQKPRANLFGVEQPQSQRSPKCMKRSAANAPRRAQSPSAALPPPPPPPPPPLHQRQ